LSIREASGQLITEPDCPSTEEKYHHRQERHDRDEYSGATGERAMDKVETWEAGEHR